MKTATLLTATLLGSLLVSCSKSDDADWLSLQQQQQSAQPLTVGMDYQGGIIAYIDETGKHGLIVAREEFGPAPWGCSGMEVPGARDMVDGKANTVAIEAACPGNGAALCTGFIATDRTGMFTRTYSDWHLPAFSELVEIVHALKDKSNMCGKTYWTSTEATGSFQAMPINPADRAWIISVSCSQESPEQVGLFAAPGRKTGQYMVRPVRRF
jgi:hypothetical protein